MIANAQTDQRRAQARAIFEAGVAAADPAARTRTVLAEHTAEIQSANSVVLLAGGKAALAMIAAALDVIPRDKIAKAIAVTNPENAQAGTPDPIVEMHVGQHPVPDEGGQVGARAVETAARNARSGDLVICLISGGASAILPAPIETITLADKIATTELLLASGADIVAMNVVRTALSRLKGGGLAMAASPARVLSLILSDVPGDDPATIASGPTVPRRLAPNQAWQIIVNHGLADRVPASVRTALEGAGARAPDDNLDITNIVIGSNALSLKATEQAARDQGFETIIAAQWLDGDVADACALLVEQAKTAAHDHLTGPIAILAGGETTVHVTGNGKGGRNQELALRFAVAARDHGLSANWVMLSGGTDGRDGPTDAAGGLVDPSTLDRIAKAGLSVADTLARNDAYPTLEGAGDLLVTGPTGTNVADLQILLLG